MKRVALWLVGAGIASLSATVVLCAKDHPVQPPATQRSSATPSQERVAFTFSDEAQMRRFAKLWGRRQATVTRLAVLQEYANQEQADLADVNQQLLSQYNLDVSKNYTLDSDRKVLLERLAPPQGSAKVGPAPPLALPSNATANP